MANTTGPLPYTLPTEVIMPTMSALEREHWRLLAACDAAVDPEPECDACNPLTGMVETSAASVTLEIPCPECDLYDRLTADAEEAAALAQMED